MAITWDDINVRFDRISKKDWYIYLSLVVCAFLVGAAINDVVHLKLTQRTEYTTNKFTMALLLLHTLAFYFGLLGFIYTAQAQGATSRTAVLAICATVGNLIAIFFRITLEIVNIDYREEFYRLAAESGK